MSILERLLTIFAPVTCGGCGQEGAALCPVCRSLLSRPKGRCFGCGALGMTGCISCLSAAGLNSLDATTDYIDLSKRLVARLKFEADRAAATVIAETMVPLLPTSATLVTYVPATPAHVRQRGYDQAWLIARAVGRHCGLPVFATLARSGSQYQLGADREQRIKQLTAAIRPLRPGRFVGRDIVLIDDVLTTGSSLRVAAHCLRRAGARSVHAIVFAQSIK